MVKKVGEGGGKRPTGQSSWLVLSGHADITEICIVFTNTLKEGGAWSSIGIGITGDLICSFQGELDILPLWNAHIIKHVIDHYTVYATRFLSHFVYEWILYSVCVTRILVVAKRACLWQHGQLHSSDLLFVYICVRACVCVCMHVCVCISIGVTMGPLQCKCSGKLRPHTIPYLEGRHVLSIGSSVTPIPGHSTWSQMHRWPSGHYV